MRAQPTADRILAVFFAGRRGVLPGSRLALDRIESDLRLAIELEGERLLGDADAVLLAAERQFARLGAVARVIGPADTTRVLERYASDALYRPTDPAEARQRVETCSALLRRLAVEPQLAGRARLLRRADEAIRVEAGVLSPLRRLRVRRVRS